MRQRKEPLSSYSRRHKGQSRSRHRWQVQVAVRLWHHSLTCQAVVGFQRLFAVATPRCAELWQAAACNWPTATRAPGLSQNQGHGYKPQHALRYWVRCLQESYGHKHATTHRRIAPMLLQDIRLRHRAPLASLYLRNSIPTPHRIQPSHGQNAPCRPQQAWPVPPIYDAYWPRRLRGNRKTPCWPMCGNIWS